MCVCVCEGVEIVYGYHYYRMVMQADNLFIETSSGE
jgi:hypothetical protein